MAPPKKTRKTQSRPSKRASRPKRKSTKKRAATKNASRAPKKRPAGRGARPHRPIQKARTQPPIETGVALAPDPAPASPGPAPQPLTHQRAHPGANPLPPSVRFIGWTLTLMGLSSLAVTAWGTAVVLGTGGPLVGANLRQGAETAILAAAAFQFGQLLVGIHLLRARPWAHPTALAACVIGLASMIYLIALAALGRLDEAVRPGPRWLFALGLGSAAFVGGFYVWAIPTLLDPEIVQRLHPPRRPTGAPDQRPT